MFATDENIEISCIVGDFYKEYESKINKIAIFDIVMS